MIKGIKRTFAAGALVLLFPAASATAQQEYPPTLYWGTGLIDIPVAWVAPLHADFFINYSGKTFETNPITPRIDYSDRLNSQLTASLSLFGRAELGVAWMSGNPEYGFFGRGLLLRQNDFRGRGWMQFLIPSIAVGVRNVGEFEKLDRFGAGYALVPPPPGERPNYKHVADELHQNFNTTNTLYGVATSEFSLADFRPDWPDLGLSLTVGYGNGLFSDDGGLGDFYSRHSTGGLFYGVKADFTPTRNLQLALMAENNAWDFNIGASAVYRGIRAGFYVTELDAGGATTEPEQPETYLYNYTKVAFTIGWQSNFYALLQGNFLRNRADNLMRERERLLAAIQERQQRIAQLQLEINRFEAQNLLELEQRRAQAAEQLRREREALQRLEERLRRVEQQQGLGNPPE